MTNSLHPVDVVLKRRFVESLQEHARRLREATMHARWDEARREIGILRSGGARYALNELEQTGRRAQESLVAPGLRRSSFFDRAPAPQIEHLLRAVDAVVAEEEALHLQDRRIS